MKLSIYTFVKDGLYYDFHVEAMLRHHAPLADEIVVNEGFSTDGTYEAIRDVAPNVKVHRFEWDRSDPASWHRKFKNQARELCTGDWAILLDCDEFIPEWEFPRLRALLESTTAAIVPMRYIHFYGNYRVHVAGDRWNLPRVKHIAHRNLPTIEVWGDGSDVRIRDQDPMPDGSVAPEAGFEVHHFGMVRRPSRLRQKWRTQAKQHDKTNPTWDKVPGFVFDMMPHQWDDKDFLADLAVYDGPPIKAVRDDPREFVRDDMWLYEHLRRQPAKV